MKYQIILYIVKNIVNLDFIKKCVIILIQKDICELSRKKFAKIGVHIKGEFYEKLK